jgi:hypothetical protein
MPVDHFPSTHATWIDAQLTIAEGCRTSGDEAGERAATGSLHRHLMERYHVPLVAYATASSLRHVAEPQDIVAGFLADRACKPGFLLSWRTSGLPLRRWMMTGVNLYGKGLIRERSRDRLRTGVEDEPGTDGDGSVNPLERVEATESDALAERAFERAWSRTVLEAALSRVHTELDAQGRLDDFAIFRRHVIHGEAYESIAAELGRTVTQCSGTSRNVLNRLRDELRAVLRDEGIPASEVDGAVADVYRAFDIERRGS